MFSDLKTLRRSGPHPSIPAPHHRAWRLLIAGTLLALLIWALWPSGLSLVPYQDVLYEGHSKDSGILYEDSGTAPGSKRSSDLYLVRVRSMDGTHDELRLGPGAADEYYPVNVGSGTEPPRIRSVHWDADGVTVAFTSGVSVRVPADRFRNTR